MEESSQNKILIQYQKQRLKVVITKCCTLYQWLPHDTLKLMVDSVAKVENCWLSNSSPYHDHTHPTCLHTSKLCLPLYSFVHQTKGLLFYNSPIGVLGLVWRRVFIGIGPQGRSNMLQHNSALFFNGGICWDMHKSFLLLFCSASPEINNFDTNLYPPKSTLIWLENSLSLGWLNRD